MLEKNQLYQNYIFLLLLRRGGEITWHQQSEIDVGIFAAFQVTATFPSMFSWQLSATRYPPQTTNQ